MQRIFFVLVIKYYSSAFFGGAFLCLVITMAKFGTTSMTRLYSCHQDLQIIFSEVVKERDCSILCGHRPEDEQRAAFSAGLSKLQFPDSKHNKVPSMAVDAAPYFS